MTMAVTTSSDLSFNRKAVEDVDAKVRIHFNATNLTHGLAMDGMVAYQWDLYCDTFHIFVEDIHLWFAIVFTRCTIM